MITELTIQNFRGLKEVSLRNLRRVNLLIGGNDTGKTSVLEALILLMGDGRAIVELPTTFRVNQTGGQPGNNQDDGENFWAWLFYDRDRANLIKVVGSTGSRQVLSLVTETVPAWNQANAPMLYLLQRSLGDGRKAEVLRFNNGDVQLLETHSPIGFRVSRLSVRPSHPVHDAEKYNQIALEAAGEARFEKIMRQVEPRLKRLRYAKLPGTTAPLVFVDIGLSRLVPATQMGAAFNRILHIYAEILSSKTNVLLIDEIENGIFNESLPLIWKGLLAVCEEQGVQVFATTHSRECVMAALAAARERDKDELSVQRLQIVKDRIEAVRLGVEHLEVAAEMGLEVRS